MKKIIIGVSLALSALTLSSSTFAGPDENIENNLKLKSFMIQYRYDPVPLPPTAPSTAFGHAFMAKLNPTNDALQPSVYKAADVAKLQAEAFAYFQKTAGLTFTPGVTYTGPIPTFIGLPAVKDSSGNAIAVAVPLSVGIDNKYYVLHDSDDEYDKNNGKWIVRNFSWIVQYLQAGTVPVGATAEGQTYAPFDIVSYGYTVHLKTDSDWMKNSKREFFTVSTTAAQKQPVTGWVTPTGAPATASDQHIALQYINERTHAVGFGSDNVYNRQPSNTAGSRVVQHPVYFFTEPPPAITLLPSETGYTTVGAKPLP